MEPVQHPVIGYRAWRVNDDGMLLPVFSDMTPWSPGVNVARCVRDVSFHASDETPAEHCQCGLYATHHWSYATGYVTSSDVLGIARGWGRMRIHFHGWRAQNAEVLALIDNGYRTPRLHEIAQRYSVPVVPLRGIDHLAAEFGRFVPMECRPTEYRNAMTGGEVTRMMLEDVATMFIKGLRILHG